MAAAIPPPTSQANGNIYSLFFDHEDHKVTIAHSEQLDIADTLTIEAMVYLTKESTGYIIAKKQSFALAVKKGQLMISMNNTKPGWVWKNTKVQLELNKWKHVAVTYNHGANGTESCVYVDGALVRRFTDMVGPLDHSAGNDLLLGVHLAEDHISGFIANVRVWKKVLSSERLTQLAFAKTASSSRSSSASFSPDSDILDSRDPDLVGWWPLDRGYGSEATDRSRFELHGTIAHYTNWVLCLSKFHDIVPSSLTADFRNMLNNPMGSDLKLRIAAPPNDPSGEPGDGLDGSRGDDNPSDDMGNFLYAHKIILATRCRVFNAMLNAEMKERHSSDIYLRDISFPALQKLIEFIYTDFVEMDGEHVVELFTAADKYDLPRLKYLCETFMIANLNTDNACTIMDTAERFHADMLGKECFRFLIENFWEINVTEAYTNLPPHLIREINAEASKVHRMSGSTNPPPAKRRKIAEIE
eukprot:TRINITY_DN393_c0_g1_i1.p1 TRINITY_DN393_c0_g1~~TRINITY_DN393_c0_g1_i1.p1  ORF type:complete len:497 (+),score=111.41 TRINITY_DN393_c0_g1_i1:80-1492(+)